jgi:O-succinylbenzoate synthase
MRIESITLRKLKMRLKSPFETSFGITHDRTVVLVELLADGLTGWSEVTASEGPFYNSETGDTAWLIIRGFLVPLILGKEVGSASEIPRIFAAIRGHEMARAGIENALWDIEAQQKNLSLPIARQHAIGNQMRCLLRAASDSRSASRKSRR